MMSWFPNKITILLFLPLIGCSAGLERDKFVIQPHPVRFTEEPHNWTVTEGASVSLTCNTTVIRVIGYINESITPVPIIRWFHNNVMISSSGHFTINNYGIDTSILTIRNVTSLEQGEYYCVVNEWVKPDGDWWIKTKSKSGYITVISNASILIAGVKEHVVLSCVEPAAVVPSSVVWAKDGAKISGNVTVVDGNLVVFEVGEENSGDYQCIDQANNTTLLYYSLTVNNTAHKYLRQQHLLIEDVAEENHFVQIRHDADIRGCMDSPVNQSVILNCKANGHQTIRWYKNGGVLDVNSEGTMFNQTTGDLFIRREDACELLGVYQCFVSNDIDTVHVSIRVLPLGWPNHPGRPELVHFKSHINKFELVTKLNPPDYLGGLTLEQLFYHVYLQDSGYFITPYFVVGINASNPLDTVRIRLRKDFLRNGLDSLDNFYYIFVILKLVNRDLSHLIALPGPSPVLRIDPICTFIVTPPPPVIVETCHHDNVSGLVIHNISWHIESQFEGLYFKFKVGWWIIAGGCTYLNGTIAGEYFNNHLTFLNHRSWKLPKRSLCNVSILYDTYCGFGTSYLTKQCEEGAIYGAAGLTAASKSKGDKNTPAVTAASLVTAVLIVTISICTILCFCYRKYSQHEQSAMKMLKNVKEINQLQSTCPISIDHQSVDGFVKSELYIEKVNRWMEYISEEPLDDLDLALEGCSLATSEMLHQIVEGRTTKNLTGSYKEGVELCDDTQSLSSNNKCGANIRRQSDDSGLESGGNSLCKGEINSELFQRCHQTMLTKVTQQVIVTDHDQFTKSESKALERDKLQETSCYGNNNVGLPRQVMKNTIICQQDKVSAAKQFGGYIGFKIVDESHFSNQDEVELVRQDHRASISTWEINRADQDHYSPTSTKESDYVGLEVIDQHQCLPKSTTNFDYAELETIDQDHLLPKQVEKVDRIPDDQARSTDKCNCTGPDLTDPDHRHLLLLPANLDNCNHEGSHTGSHCVVKSTEVFVDYVEAETDQGHPMHNAIDRLNVLEVTDQDQCASEIIVDHVNVVDQDDITPRTDDDTNDQYCRSVPSSCYSDGLKVVNQNDKPNCQRRCEGSVNSSGSHDDKSNDVIIATPDRQHCLQFNDDGYVTSTVFTGQ